MLNHIVIMGRLTRDPELRRTGTGKAVASFSLAVDRDWKPEGGERETDFIDCVAWGSSGEFVAKYFGKGSMAVVSGRLQIRTWTDKDGNKRRSAEINAESVYFGESKKSANEAPRGPQSGYDPNNPYKETMDYVNQQLRAKQGGQEPIYPDVQDNYSLLTGPDDKMPWEM